MSSLEHPFPESFPVTHMHPLLAWRRKFGYTQEAASKVLGLTIAQVSHFETGVSKPSLATIEKVYEKSNGGIHPLDWFSVTLQQKVGHLPPESVVAP